MKDENKSNDADQNSLEVSAVKRLVMWPFKFFLTPYTFIFLAFIGGVNRALQGNVSAALLWILALVLFENTILLERLSKLQKKTIDILELALEQRDT